MTQLQTMRTTVVRAVLGENNYRRAVRIVNDRRQKPRVGKVRFGDLRRVQPICREYGFDRGRPIDRYYIENFLAERSSLITGNVLEIGERTYTEQFGIGVTRSDMLHVADEPGATYVADIVDAPQIPSNTYDCIIFTQTLQMIFDLRSAVETIYRILKPGGVLLCTAPCISQIADPVWNSTWYWGFTELAGKRLFGCVFPPDGVEVSAYGNVLTATAFLQGLSERELRRNELDVFDPEYPVIVATAARKADLGTRHVDLSPEVTAQIPAVDTDVLARATEFLAGADGPVLDMTVADFVTDSASTGETQPAGLLVAHSLEHSWGWRRVMATIANRFSSRLVIILAERPGESEQRLDNERPLLRLQLPREELLSYLAGMTVREETVATAEGTETIIYVEK